MPQLFEITCQPEMKSWRAVEQTARWRNPCSLCRRILPAATKHITDHQNNYNAIYQVQPADRHDWAGR